MADRRWMDGMDKKKLALTAEAHFLDAVMKKYHFGAQERDSFFAVGRQMEDAVQESAGFWYRESGEAALAALTLGNCVDALQERYVQEGHLTECYMAEVIAGELMLQAYREFNRRVESESGRHVARYHFFGAQEERAGNADGGRKGLSGAADGLCRMSLEEIPAALRALGVEEIRSNGAYCLSPKKSVVFVARLTEDADVRCEGICTGCGRKDCPNRCDREQEEMRLRWPDLSGRALPYGYARILGK